MAPKRTPEQYGEVAAFVRELYAQSGCVSWAAFARRAQVTAMDVSNWQLGKVIPDGWHLLCLIRAAGGVPPHELMQRLEELAAILEQKLTMVTTRLSRVLDEIPVPSPEGRYDGPERRRQ